MEIVKRWFRTSSPLVKTLMAVSVTSSLVVFHRLVYAPYTSRKRYREAEAWANMIIEKEEARAALEAGSDKGDKSY